MDAVEVNTSEEPRPETTSDDVDDVSMVPEHQVEICRICLIGNPMMRGLFHEDGVMSLSDKAMSLASVKMMPGDGLPSHICSDCTDKLESAYKFKLQVEQADNVLREKLVTLNIKEELFFGDVDVNLTNHRNDVGEITEASLLLKDHMDLLSVPKISEGEADLHNQDVEKQMNHVGIEQEIGKQEDEEGNQQLCQSEEQLQIEENQVMQQISDEQQMELQEVQEMQEMVNDQHNESFGSHELQEMMLNEISHQERLHEELSQSQQLAIHEHDYVVESQPCNVSQENDMLNLEEIEKGSKEDVQKEEAKGQIESYNIIEDSTPSESVRRSKRKINQRKVQVDRDSDEENYFENLNLSSRLKRVQSEKSEKIYFMCYLCDKQFLSKEILKEHMHSHDEVRKTLSLLKKPNEKPQKSPEKDQNTLTSPVSSKTLSSGKRPNKCPHCGKEYLYIISYNKHLKQHEKEMKDETMPLEVSFHEDDDAIDFHGYEDPTMDSDSAEGEVQEENEIYVKTEPKSKIPLKCNICEEEFNSMDQLKDHCSKHVVEGALTEQDLKIENDKLNASENANKNEENIEEASTEELKKEESKVLKCPQCSMTYAHKKSLARHMESHGGTKYSCKVCHQSFTRRDHLRRHSEQHLNNRLKSFKCTQCNKTFGNELTLRNHLIATNHKTVVHGQEYDPNKRIKRVAAKAAQKIIDQIKTDLNSDEFEEEERREKEREKNYDVIKEEVDIVEDEITEYVPEVPKKVSRSNKTLICVTCNQKCPSKQALAKHMAQHVNDENAVKQEKPNIEEKRENEDNEDENEEDDDNFEGGLGWPIDNHECPTCKKRYSTKKSLMRHQLLHEEPNFECDICNVKFYRKDKLKVHYDKCSEKNPDQVRKCNICGDIFENNEILKEHRAKHVTEGILTEEDLREIEPRPEDKNGEKAPRKRRTDIVGLECTECNKQYTSRKGLLRHIQVHEGKKYLCDICPKKFYRREHLKIHVAKHNMIKPYKCPRCTKRFIKEEQLNNHLTKHERTFKKAKETDTSKRFLCEICSKSFTQSTTLIAHLRAHNGIKPYVCEVCSRPFTTNAYLKMHMRTHTQERPYICQYCSRAFARADTLANHLTSHTGEAKYHCKFCPKNFRRLKSLKEHVFIHTGQRPYACPTCDRRFNNNGSRYAHSKRCKQNLLQVRSSQINMQNMNVEQELQEQEEQEQLQLQEQQQQQEIQNQLQQPQRIHQATISQTQIIKPQNIKTITITRPDGTLGQQHVMTHQEILMPLILPLTVTLTDVGEEVILPEGTKIYTA